MGGKVSTLELTLNVEGKCGENGNKKCNCDNSGKFVAEKKTDDPVKGFTKYAHSVTSGTFTLDGTLGGGGKIKVGGVIQSSIENVTEVAVYYWSHLDNKDETTPLLLEVKYGGTTIYYVSSGSSNDWIYHGILQGPALEQKLDDLNCQHNSAVTIDLSKGLSNSQTKYCCSGNHTDGTHNRITVTSTQVRCNKQDHISTHLTYYKHETNLGNGVQLAAIKYNDSTGQRKRLKLGSLILPTKQSVKVAVYAFYCKDSVPKLIYVEGRDPNVTGWYKKPNSRDNNSGDEQWIEVLSVFLSITPKDLSSSIDHDEYNNLVTALNKFTGCTSYKQCPTTPVPAESGKTERSTGGLLELPIATSLWSTFGVSSGPLAGAGGLTGFGWWMFKRSKGDPWVRQI
ncbi:hypothetical protein BEWA_023140 [Theileria equi strain WA]|uniref:Uncharacterized protein n=1 Tax=Theileria equi strain WA TaxID=1537102 RepID=L0AVA0_THEEQ|nr:hypothetical protein BEWA_023140 [Theileria equi strain WA]AFZ79465.1 hypothetical protein BEWA_023140 [Theileria equi strain WA]|eukprot:XP_004829131.1 hypothetical protein BEWA_023140 [Theileria equi strain WA]